MTNDKLRRRIVFEAARLMYSRQESEYYRAKMKAAKRICRGWVKPSDLPSNAEIRDEILRFAHTYEGDTRFEKLRDMRLEALRVMRILSHCKPRLIGSTLTGHVRQGSDIDIHVFAATAETVTAALDAEGMVYDVQRKRVRKHGEERLFTHVHIQDQFPIELTIYPPDKTSYVFKSSITGKAIERAGLTELELFLQQEYPDLDLSEEALAAESGADRFMVYRSLLLPLSRVKQHRVHHPEGDVLYHSLQVYDLAVDERPYDEELQLAALLHDVGKGIDPKNHVEAGLDALGEYITDRTAWLIAHHMDAHRVRDGTIGARAHRRLRESEDFEELMILEDCDDRGREPGVDVPDLDDALDEIRELITARARNRPSRKRSEFDAFFSIRTTSESPSRRLARVGTDFLTAEPGFRGKKPENEGRPLNRRRQAKADFMKSEERHELNTNELEKLTEALGKFFERYGSKVIMGIAAAIVVGVGIYFALNWGGKTAESASGQIAQAEATSDFATVADNNDYSGLLLQTYARLTAAERQYEDGVRLYLTTTEGGLAELKEALENFDKVLAAKGVPNDAKERAMRGRAFCLEAMSDGDTSKAVEAFETYLKEYPDTKWKEIIDERIESLKTNRAKELYAFLSSDDRRPDDRKLPSELRKKLRSIRGHENADFSEMPITLPRIPGRLTRDLDTGGAKPFPKDSPSGDGKKKPEAKSGPAFPSTTKPKPSGEKKAKPFKAPPKKAEPKKAEAKKSPSPN
eukprot:g8428.t1